jgi:hypothetical protein
MASNQFSIRFTGDEKKWLQDTNKALELMDKKTQGQELRRVHAPYTLKGSREMRLLVPYEPKTSRYKGGTQPYGHLKNNIKSQTLRSNRNGKAVVVNMDAFNYNFIEHGTRDRRRKNGARTGSIRGNYKKPSSSPWNHVGFIKTWAERKADLIIKNVPEDYNKKIFEPNAAHVKKKYNVLVKFNFPAR